MFVEELPPSDLTKYSVWVLPLQRYHPSKATNPRPKVGDVPTQVQVQPYSQLRMLHNGEQKNGNQYFGLGDFDVR